MRTPKYGTPNFGNSHIGILKGALAGTLDGIFKGAQEGIFLFFFAQSPKLPTVEISPATHTK